MRVIAGSARRLLLKTLPGDETRPTTDRIKETLFNMLQAEIPGSRFLDLFGGSGGIAIEALSRGASHAVIVEKNPKAARIIRENLEHTHLDDRAELLTIDASAAITRLAGRESAAFDLIFLDPPYGLGLEDRALAQLLSTALLQADTLLIVETDIEADPTRFETLGYSVLKVKEYKTNQHIFLQRRYDET